ncbi:hypothetical protein [Oceanobacillus sp. CAU 1775]
MKKAIKIVVIIVLVLLYSTAYTAASPEITPQKLYNHTLLNHHSNFKQFVTEVEQLLDLPREKNAVEKEVEQFIETEKKTTLRSVDHYYDELLTEIKLFNSDDGRESITAYEQQKLLEVDEEIDKEIIEYINELINAE